MARRIQTKRVSSRCPNGHNHCERCDYWLEFYDDGEVLLCFRAHRCGSNRIVRVKITEAVAAGVEERMQGRSEADVLSLAALLRCRPAY